LKKISILTIVILFLGIISFSGSARENFEEKISELLEEYRVPGAAVALIENGEIVFIKSFGYRDKEKGIKMTRSSIFQTASLSKPLVAFGVLELVERGKLALDDPAEKFLTRWKLPEGDHNSGEITIRMLLSHTSGLGPGGYLGYPPGKEVPTLVEALQGEIAGSRGIEFVKKPGAEFFYSGGGYTVLQLIIEEVTGRDFSEFMENEVLLSLGMEDSFFSVSSDKKDNIAVPYSVYGGKLPVYNFAEKAAAGLYSTVEDLAIFIQHCFEMSSAREIMFEPVEDGYGLGWQIEKLEDGRIFAGHGGSNRGWKSNLAMIPTDKVGLIVLTNGDRGMPFYRELTNFWLAAQNTGYTIDTPGRYLLYLIDLYQRFNLWFSHR